MTGTRRVFACLVFERLVFERLVFEKGVAVAHNSAVEPTPAVEPTRRDFLYIATTSVAAVGAAAVAWPFVQQMNPDASVQALASISVDLTAIEVGQSVTVTWQGKPVFIRHRTAQEIEEARTVALDRLPDQSARNVNKPGADARDENRVSDPQWLIMVGVCTHLGCIPVGEAGEFHGWLCPCHGSHYDVSGRIRKGPAPENMLVPTYVIEDGAKVKIG